MYRLEKAIGTNLNVFSTTFFGINSLLVVNNFEEKIIIPYL